MDLLSVLGALLTIGITYYLVALTRAYLVARKINLPIYLTPVDSQNFLWIVFSVPLQPLFKRLLPPSLYMRLELCIFGFETRVRNKPLEMFGGSYLLVGPGSVEFWTQDPVVMMQVLGNKDIRLSGMSVKFMKRFGSNLLTSHGENWQRQRKIVAPIINESISASVWEEGNEQAAEMLDSFLTNRNRANDNTPSVSATSGVTHASIEGLRRIAINVLGAVGYGKPKRWSITEDPAPPGYKLGYMESLFVIINNLAAVVLIPTWIMCLPVFPTKVGKLATAAKEYPIHNRKMVAQERQSADPTKNTLMSVIVRLSDQEKEREKKANSTSTPKSRLYLSEDEIYGTMFVFTLAGFDTTANTMAFALVNLAVYPEWQEWMLEEIDSVIPACGEKPDYKECFPRLKRVLAVMFETLRIYSPLQHLARESSKPMTVTTSSGTIHTIPAGTLMLASISMTQVNPTVWGSDALEFRPSRWLSTDSSKNGELSLIEPPKGSFLPWSGGHRYCPGMKMSQVEFVSVFSALFKRSRVEPAPRVGETFEHARERLKGIMADSQPLITLQMKRPSEVGLKWKAR